MLKNVAHKNDKKREAALKNEAGGEEKHLFFTWPNPSFFWLKSKTWNKVDIQ